MTLTCSSKLDNSTEENETSLNVAEFKVVKKSVEENLLSSDEAGWQEEGMGLEQYDAEEPVVEQLHEFDEEEEQEQFSDEVDARDFSQNHVSLTFSWSLMNQLRYMARTEGISVEDLLIELVTEGATKRVFEDQNKPLPSHLMTRNGYVHNEGQSHSGHPQPQMSHHTLNNNRNPNAQVNRNKPGAQARGGHQYNNNNNTSRYQNQNNQNSSNSNSRSYQGNNRNQQSNTAPFKQNGNTAANSYNPQQRQTPRSSVYSNQPATHSNQPQQRPFYENTDNNAPGNTQFKNRK
jgi:hypothetical protein